ncbi:MAG: hypothetical protein ABL908_17750 [Hyphomicrobium sp.]
MVGKAQMIVNHPNPERLFVEAEMKKALVAAGLNERSGNIEAAEFWEGSRGAIRMLGFKMGSKVLYWNISRQKLISVKDEN